MNRTRTLFALVALLAVLLSAGGALAQGNRGRSNFDWIVARTFTVREASVITDGGLTLTDDNLTLTSGDVVITDGNASINDDLNIDAQAAISVTMNATITPLGSYQPLSSAGTVNTSSITAGTVGDLLVLINTTATSIVLTDTSTLKLTGNLTLGQFDSVTLWSDGTNWIQVATANN